MWLQRALWTISIGLHLEKRRLSGYILARERGCGMVRKKEKSDSSD
jgi:hypothetical protein